MPARVQLYLSVNNDNQKAKSLYAATGWEHSSIRVFCTAVALHVAACQAELRPRPHP